MNASLTLDDLLLAPRLPATENKAKKERRDERRASSKLADAIKSCSIF